MKPMNHLLEQFYNKQLRAWPEVAERYRTLHTLSVKRLYHEHSTPRIILNPARAGSVLARVPEVTAEPATQPAPRPCPLCKQNRPDRQLALSGKPMHGYTVLLNPYPIFDRHFTIVANHHEPQRIEQRLQHLLHMALLFTDYTLFYNGPAAGASLPEHAHFQAVPQATLPLQAEGNDTRCEVVARHRTAALWLITDATGPHFTIESPQVAHAQVLAERLLDCIGADALLMINIVARHTTGGGIHLNIHPRRKHRPQAFYATGAERLTVSPASAELEGVISTVDPETFERLTAHNLNALLAEVRISTAQAEALAARVRQKGTPYEVSVGILTAKSISMNLITPFVCRTHPGDEPVGADEPRLTGNQIAVCRDGAIWFAGRLHSALHLVPATPQTARCRMHGIIIGKEFHWQQKKTQEFMGRWSIVVEGNKLLAINHVDAEVYLQSVVSSEMSATAPVELIKAHAVIARSWLVRMLEKRPKPQPAHRPDAVWHEAGEHTRYDVCADDHCQRYQGIHPNLNADVVQAVKDTRGEVITYNGEVIDARYSKCCGGRTEVFATAWADEEHPYLLPVTDDEHNTLLPDEGDEDYHRLYIYARPDAWCNVKSAEVLARSLNDFDQSTRDHFRWQVTYEADELSQLIRTKLGHDLGRIIALNPLHRGPSGRIDRLQIVGTKQSIIIGKELEVRRALSATHLYSSAFVVETEGEPDMPPTLFRLIGAGWGHGVGLCQIGAANMAANGYHYHHILTHYYKQTHIDRLYE